MTVATTPVSGILEIQVRTTSAADTRSLGAWLADAARPGDRIALTGTLGSGKTQLAKGFAAGLGVREVVNSPSFTLMAEYEGRLPLFHQDLYRLAGAEEAYAGGLLDERQDAGVTLSEWADRLGEAAGAERLEIHLEAIDGEVAPGAAGDTLDDVPDVPRRILLRATAGYQRYLDRGRAWPGRQDDGGPA
jgi:tRNA threonylcarbamoyladenosine biosynthesis protein TsaE